MSNSLHYYNTHAEAFFSDTVDLDMSELHAQFLQHVPAGGYVLDAGCGSGRDSKAFLTLGYRVEAFDASPEMASMATRLLGQLVITRSFEQVNEVACYDGIWACASLLHLPESALPDTFERLWAALKPVGVFYLSFKLGNGEREHGGRHFTDATEGRLRHWIAQLVDVASLESWITHDRRPNRVEYWLNALLHRGPAYRL